MLKAKFYTLNLSIIPAAEDEAVGVDIVLGLIEVECVVDELGVVVDEVEVEDFVDECAVDDLRVELEGERVV